MLDNSTNSSEVSSLWDDLKTWIRRGGDLWILFFFVICSSILTIKIAGICFNSKNSWCIDLNLVGLHWKQAMLLGANVSTMLMGVYFYVVKLNKWGMIRGFIVWVFFLYWILTSHYANVINKQIILSASLLTAFFIIDFVIAMGSEGRERKILIRNVLRSSLPGALIALCAFGFIKLFDWIDYPGMNMQDIETGAAIFAWIGVIFSNLLFCIINFETIND